jgi:nitroimidazol reductase NimA-like FMN-containing flavoprotein (pyridoxamine 5'-phosphate oxidase superfamily)
MTAVGRLLDLTLDECMRRLAHGGIGRVAYCDEAGPIVVPVNYCTTAAGEVVFRTGPGSKLSAILTSAAVAFEVDGIDPIYHGGWSVVVRGIAHLVDDTDERDRLADLPLSPWVTPSRDIFVRITPAHITGRRIHTH